MIFDLLAWFMIFMRDDWERDPWISKGSKLASMSLYSICSIRIFFSTKIRHRWYSKSLNIVVRLSIFDWKRLFSPAKILILYFFMLLKLRIESESFTFSSSMSYAKINLERYFVILMKSSSFYLAKVCTNTHCLYFKISIIFLL